ncbi:MAG: hypothetical protein ACRD9R_11260 [Pyrinomonadaceae bacterium]
MPKRNNLHRYFGPAARLACIGIVSLLSSCVTLARKEDTGVVIARRAQVRSSTAIVAADLSEVTRGDVVDILDSKVAETNDRWLLVRVRDAENTEGWIEERHVLSQELLDHSRRLAEEDKDIPAQATGQLRANTNLRSSPERGDNNLLLKLESGANFEIVGWKRVAKAKNAETPEGDDAAKDNEASGASPKGGSGGVDKNAEDGTELWYKVRLRPAESPAPAGWVFGRQVDLTVPSDIIYYRTGREFVAWQRLDNADKGQIPAGKDAAVETPLGSWVILEKSSMKKDGDPLAGPDFDRIFVLGYDKSRQEHYTAYRSPDVFGLLPLVVTRGQNADETIFSVRVRKETEAQEVRFKAYKDNRGILRIEPLDELPRSRK